jgi:gliding motility-associated protein GldE
LDPSQQQLFAQLYIFNSITTEIVIYLVAFVILIILSALISGSEVAYFAIDLAERERLKKEQSVTSIRILELLNKPKELLATILIANNFVNVTIVAVSTFVMNSWINPDVFKSETVEFIVQVVAVTFLILLFGEVIPKVYATKKGKQIAVGMSLPMTVLIKVLSPISRILVSSTNLIDKRIKKKPGQISVEDLVQAMNITEDVADNKEDKKILEGIVRFGNTDAKQVMIPRLDVVSFSIQLNFSELKNYILEHKFSRVPIYNNTIDTVKGILYIKDLLPYIHLDDFDWQSLLRKPMFIPENKKLDDLLTDFKHSRTHLAIVVDEYGGTSGVITLEDILEEIVGEITDEFDDEDLIYTKLNDHSFVFEGKISLIDMYRILEIEGADFEEEKGESDTIAGFCIEQAGKILRKNEKVQFKNYTFIIEAADRRKIKQVKVIINPELEEA